MRPVEQLLRATAKAEADHFWFRGFRAFVTPLIHRALVGRREARILDCGCGTGANVQMMSRAGRTFGFDLSSTGLHIGRKAGRSRLVQATVTAAPFGNDIFDLVTSFDVLYSLSEPDARAAVAEMFRMTRPGGFALINVAAMPVLRGDHSILSREVRRYRRSDLRKLVSCAGFGIVRLTYTNFTLFVPMIVMRMAQRWRGLRAEDRAEQEISIPPAPVNALLTCLLLLEGLYLRGFNAPFGSSLLCLAKKPDRAPASTHT
jgi:ubiquinone/menaquinone biosynthesis C-methylase UbiE